jgi:hypothetical protein
MLRRQLLLFGVVAAPVAFFAFRTPLALLALPLAGVVAWSAASPVSWPRWLGKGLARAVPASAALALALWLLTR